MCLSSLVFAQLFFESRTVEPPKPARKQNLTPNRHSGSFKVMHFGITEKLTTDYVLLYNNAGVISKVSEKMASENAENWRCRQSHCLLTPPRQRTSANIRINLISPESRVIGLHSWRWKYSDVCDGLRKTHLFCSRMRIGRSRSSKVVDFGTNRKGACNFLLVINSKFGPILHRFWDTAENCEFFLASL